MRSITVFEVDHPDPQTTKRKALERALSVLPTHVRVVAIDFKQGDLATPMTAAGYRHSVHTFILWEGVTNYLTEDAVDTTLRWCARASPGSVLLFTCAHRDVLTKPSTFIGTENLFAALERAGERLTFGIDPSQLPEFLTERGLSLELDLGAAEYRERHFGTAARGMRGA